MEVYAAFRSVPDYHAPPPTLVSLHDSLDGAKKALYPDRKDFRDAFRPKTRFIKGVSHLEWDGPDGFGLIRLLEILP